MEATLFSDLTSFEILRDQQHTQRVLNALEQIDLAFLGTNPERRLVIRKLAHRNIKSIGQLLKLHRGEVSEWPGVGNVFLTLFDEMREEVHADPEKTVMKWINESAPLSLPHDFNRLHPFENTEQQWFSEESLSDTDALTTTSPDDIPSTSTNSDWFAEVIEIECVFTEIIHLLQTRLPDLAEILRRFYLEGLTPEVIANVLGLRSPSVVTHTIDYEFLRPLLAGEALSHLTLDPDFPPRIEALRDRLLLMPVAPLTTLTAMLPERFLHFLDLTVMERSTTEFTWAADLIVPIGEIITTRRLLRATLTYLQQAPSFVPISKVSAELLPRFASPRDEGEDKKRTDEEQRLNALLKHHPWIEHSPQGVRLIAEQLQFDYCRIARILADAGCPLTEDEIYTRYEHRYFERPRTIDHRLLRKHFPNLHIRTT